MTAEITDEMSAIKVQCISMVIDVPNRLTVPCGHTPAGKLVLIDDTAATIGALYKRATKPLPVSATVPTASFSGASNSQSPVHVAELDDDDDEPPLLLEELLPPEEDDELEPLVEPFTVELL